MWAAEKILSRRTLWPRPGAGPRDAVPLRLAQLVRKAAFVEAYFLPLLSEEARRAEGWYVAHTYGSQDNSYSLQIFVWPLGARTQIHDHTSWGAFCCCVGSVLEKRYE